MCFSLVAVCPVARKQAQELNPSVVRSNLQSSQMERLASNGCKALWVIITDVRVPLAYE